MNQALVQIGKRDKNVNVDCFYIAICNRDSCPQDLYTMTMCGVDKPGKAFFVEKNRDLNRNSTGFK